MKLTFPNLARRVESLETQTENQRSGEPIDPRDLSDAELERLLKRGIREANPRASEAEITAEMERMVTGAEL